MHLIRCQKKPDDSPLPLGLLPDLIHENQVVFIYPKLRVFFLVRAKNSIHILTNFFGDSVGSPVKYIDLLTTYTKLVKKNLIYLWSIKQ